MKEALIERKTKGITPTAAYIQDIYTGKFQELLPGIFIIKGAKNDRGFDQGFGITKGEKELLLIDVVEEAYREAIAYLSNNGYTIRAILITGKGVRNDMYSDFQKISEDADGADIYIHPDIAPEDFETRPLNQRDELLANFDLEPHVIPGKEGQVVMYCSRHNGIVFSGDSAVGSDYDTTEFILTRGREKVEKLAFKVEEFWQSFERGFEYFFPRKGKPAVDVDVRTRTTLLDRLAEGEEELD